jgi:quercetin dioxygenase-like cupin family protein
MLIAFLICGVMTTIVVVVGGLLGVIGFVLEAPKEFPEEFGIKTPPPTLPIVTELCRHEIPGVHGKEGRVLMVELPSGVHGNPHRPPGTLFAHVLQGTVMSTSNDAPAQQYGPGDTWFEPPMQFGVWDSNEGLETAKLLVFDLTEPDQPMQFFEPDEENRSVPYPKTRAQVESSLTPSGHDIGRSR